MQSPPAGGERLRALLSDAASFFETHLWESEQSRAARGDLAAKGLREEVIRDFGVGYAPIGDTELIDHLTGLGYSRRELVDAGLAIHSRRRHVHPYFRSRIMFPVRDHDGTVLGFVGLATHVAPSWSLWVASPNAGLYQRARAVFGLDQAAAEISASGTAAVKTNCIEVLLAHQDGQDNAVAVHSNRVTREQMLELSADLPGGIDALELDLSPGIKVDPKDQPAPAPAAASAPADQSEGTAARAESSGGFHPKLVAIVIATGLAALNLITVAPLVALWAGSHVQSKKLLTTTGVLVVIVVLGVIAFALGWALTWLTAKYDELTGRPPTLARTSPWHRNMVGELDAHVRMRFSLSPPERVVAACVLLAFLVFEVWFFFIAGSPLGSA
jgi:hypothetical protein